MFRFLHHNVNLNAFFLILQLLSYLFLISVVLKCMSYLFAHKWTNYQLSEVNKYAE